LRPRDTFCVDSSCERILTSNCRPSLSVTMVFTDFNRSLFLVSDITGNTVEPYGVVVLSVFAASQMSLYKLPSGMGRKLLFMDLSIQGKERCEVVRIGTVHLESLYNSFSRKVQLKLIATILNVRNHSILVGDFNFGENNHFDEDPNNPFENEVLNEIYPNHDDVWKRLYPDEIGVTVDCLDMLAPHSKKDKGSRFDRIIMSASSDWNPEIIEIIGSESIGVDDRNPNLYVFISDHLGLYSKISINW